MRKVLVAVSTAALVGIPAVPAVAAPEDCPQAVRDVRGTQPTHDQVGAMIAAAATKHQVPAPLLQVIAYKESTWRQFGLDRAPIISTDGVCGVGIMQVTADGRDDAVKLAEDPAYNVEQGAKILREKWDLSQTTPPPTGYAADDADVVENWYYALCLYNGCDGTTDAYAASAANILHDPFRYLPPGFRQRIRPAGFTKPSDADPAYVFPTAFQARQNPDEFVFYDHTTGVVSKVVPRKTHRWSAPPVVSYPAYATGPDGDPAWETVCTQCGGWRLAEGAGLTGRAHWTNSVTGGDQAGVTWSGFSPGANRRMRVDAYVPAIGADTLGVATYHLVDGGTLRKSVTIDQNARKGGWVTLGEVTYWNSPGVQLGDSSTVAGRKIVADAVRIVPLPALRLTEYAPPSIRYGTSFLLSAELRDHSDITPMAGRAVKFYRRVRGTTAWSGVGTWKTDDNGVVAIEIKPDRNYEYTTRFVPNPGEYLASAASGNVRIDVAPDVRAALSRTYITNGQSTTLTTSVAPGHAGQAVHVQRFYSGMWRTVATRTLNAYSKASWTFSMNGTRRCETDRHQFRVVKPADRDHVVAVSRTVELLVTWLC